LLAHNVAGTNAILTKVAAFCEYTGMEVRPEKCEVTRINFGTAQPLDASRVQYKGTRLPAILPDQATKYLWFHISLTLDWRKEKKYVMTKMIQAVEQVRNTCYTRSQVMMLLRTCIIPIFRYSAPSVPWTAAELYDIDKLWSRVVKYSLHPPISFNLAHILLDRAQGGMGLEPAANFMLKEIQIHVRQCLQMEGEVSALMIEAASEVMMSLGMCTAQDVYKVGTSKVVKDLLATTPVFRMHALLQHTYWGELEWLTHAWPYGKPLAAVVRYWLATRSFNNANSNLGGITGPKAEQAGTVMKVLTVMHRAGVSTVQHLWANHGWGLKEHNGLTVAVQKQITSAQYKVFLACVMGHPGARLLVEHTQSVLTMLPPGGFQFEGAPRESSHVFSMMGELEGLIWTSEDMALPDEALLGHPVCKHFCDS
jgi:hypothetical protein